MRNKLFLLLSLLLIGTMVLAACGGGQAEPTAAPATEAPAAPAATEEPTAAPTEPPATEAPAAAATEVATEAAAPAAAAATLTVWADEKTAPVLEGLAPDALAKFGIELKVVQKGFGDLRNDYKIAAPTGEGPDILLGSHDWIGEFNDSGLLAEVSLGAKADSFADVGKVGFTYPDGKLYGMPLATENVVFYYNKDTVPTPPTTFDEVKALSKELKDAGKKYGFLIQTTDPYHFYPVQTAFGGYVFGKNSDGSYNAEDVGMNSEGSVAAFEWLNSMYEDGLLDRGSNIDGGLLLSAFQNGDAQMAISGPWALSGFREAGVNYGIAPIPTGTEAGRPFSGVRGFMINKFSKNQLLAQTFLQEFVATDATMKQIYDSDPRPPAWLPLAATIEDADIKAILDAGAGADPMPNIPAMNSVWQGYGDAMTLISNGTGEVVPTLDNAQKQITDAIAAGQ